MIELFIWHAKLPPEKARVLVNYDTIHKETLLLQRNWTIIVIKMGEREKIRNVPLKEPGLEGREIAVDADSPPFLAPFSRFCPESQLHCWNSYNYFCFCWLEFWILNFFWLGFAWGRRRRKKRKVCGVTRDRSKGVPFFSAKCGRLLGYSLIVIFPLWAFQIVVLDFWSIHLLE